MESLGNQNIQLYHGIIDEFIQYLPGISSELLTSHRIRGGRIPENSGQSGFNHRSGISQASLSSPHVMLLLEETLVEFSLVSNKQGTPNTQQCSGPASLSKNSLPLPLSSVTLLALILCNQPSCSLLSLISPHPCPPTPILPNLRVWVSGRNKGYNVHYVIMENPGA